MGQPVQISTASVPEGYCPTNLQEAWPYLVALLMAELSGAVGTFNQGDTTPAPDDQDKPWLPPSFSGGNPPSSNYNYVNGKWIMPHPIATGIGTLYWGTEGSIDTLDGGEAGIITETTGPMWAKVAALNGRIPIGPGQVGSTLIGVNDTGGTHEHTITADNLPAHSHTITPDGADYFGSGNHTPARPIVDDDYGSSRTTLSTSSYGGQADGTAKVIPHLNPYVGTFFIVRTARKFYRR